MHPDVQAQFLIEKRRWNSTDDCELRELYPTQSLNSISKQLNRSPAAISIRASKLGLKKRRQVTANAKVPPTSHRVRWTNSEIEILLTLAKEFKIREIAKILNRADGSIRSRLMLHGIEIDCKTQFWTSEESHFLEKNIGILSYEQISAKLGKSIKAIKNRMTRMGLHKATAEGKSSWTCEQISILIQLYPTSPWLEITKATQHTKNQAYKKAKRLGLQRDEALSQRRLHPIGHEIQRGKCLYRKVDSTGDKKKDWKRVDVIMWEESNGPVPPGMILVRKILNQPRTLDNLQLLKIADIPIMNFTSQLTPELRKILTLKGSITRKVNQLERQMAN